MLPLEPAEAPDPPGLTLEAPLDPASLHAPIDAASVISTRSFFAREVERDERELVVT
jgi:hypothetical protein